MKLEWIIGFPLEHGLLSLMQIAADRTLLSEGIVFPCFASVRLCDDETIRTMNRDFRHVDQATDVLSFPSVRWKKGETAGKNPQKLQREYDAEENACFLGDIVISVDHLRKQAREYGHSEAREAAYLLVHSLCHLMGYDHMEEQEKRKMREKEESVLKSVGITTDREWRVSDDVLLELAREAMKRSYSPYSGYPVGAALLSADGRVFQGTNVENASFGATICAERTAMVKAISEGASEFEAIAIATGDIPGWPCGICRQFLSEFSPNIRILVTWGNGKHVEKTTLQHLLPHQFDLEKKA